MIGRVVRVDSRHHTADVGEAEVSPLEMDLTNTVAFRGKGLENDVLVLPIRGAFRWLARIETIPEAIHLVQRVVGVLAGAHPCACHLGVLRSECFPRTAVERFAKDGPRAFLVS